jgi:hypothetical protein
LKLLARTFLDFSWRSRLLSNVAQNIQSLLLSVIACPA